jgi:hypothetical protein
MATSAVKNEPAAKRVEVTIQKAVGPGDDKVHTWPHRPRGVHLCDPRWSE